MGKEEKYRYIIFENWPSEESYRLLDSKWVKAKERELKAWQIKMAEELLGHLSMSKRAKKIGLTRGQYQYRKKNFKLNEGEDNESEKTI